ncbi:MAG: AzlC family ABC transporter permease [Clostridia bacterium]
MQNSFRKGLRDGIPIALGYLSVSFTFGIMATAAGLPVWAAIAISMTNLTSAGQFAGLALIVSGAPLVEMALTQLVINIRYALMSLSLSQKFDKSVTRADRLAIAFGNTDEIFAVASAHTGEVGSRYMYGLIVAPYIGWTLGTIIGAVAGEVLPPIVTSALGIAIYGMFLAIIVPPARVYRPVLRVIAIAVAVSCAFFWIPGLNKLSSGFVIIICAVVAAGIGAVLYPIKEGAESE